ncbi:hypothetical protein LR68_00636 [Anoxybacillus sp. BCO1]|nr:hypothetical protein LR68_00636 [Anoxybacillus sp. BCO1]
MRMVLMKEIGTVCVEQISDEQLLQWLYAFAEEGGETCDSSDSRGNDCEQ